MSCVGDRDTDLVRLSWVCWYGRDRFKVQGKKLIIRTLGMVDVDGRVVAVGGAESSKSLPLQINED